MKDNKEVECDFLARSMGYGGVEDLKVISGELVGWRDDDKFKRAMNDNITMDDYDAFILVGLENIVPALGMYSRQLLTEYAFEFMENGCYPFFSLIKQITENCEAKIILIIKPFPAEGKKEDIRYSSYVNNVRYFNEEFLSKNHIEILPQPLETIESDLLVTRSKYLQPAGDMRHMNKEYGVIVLNHLFKALRG